MLRTLLTPLRAHVDTSPRTAKTSSLASVLDDNELAPEEFAREVMMELMRNSVENLKLAQDIETKTQVLSEIYRIIQQNGDTKDVFRQLDGFLILMSVLSNVRDYSHDFVVEPEEEVLSGVKEMTSLVFMCMSEAMNEHSENTEYFQTIVGYDSLVDALHSLISDKRTVDFTSGFLFSFAIHNFNASDIFSNIRTTREDELEEAIGKIVPQSGTVRHPGAMLILWNAMPQLTAGNASMRYALFKLFEHLSHVSHRNQAVLSSLGIVKSLFGHLYDARNNTAVSDKERHTLQKLLRRLLEMGATTSEARVIFQKAIRSDETLDTEVLDVIRFGMKSRWLEHFSMEPPSALLLSEHDMKGLPVAGFTFMAWVWVSELPSSSPHVLFTFKLSSHSLLTMSVHPGGQLELSTSANPQPAIFVKSKILRFRWTHVTLIHYPHRVSNTSIRLFVDGVLTDTLDWSYPKPESSAQTGTFVIGDASENARMSWCLASSHLISAPLADDLPRFIHHLGPRYAGNFQEPNLIKFLTYEASTSLNMFLSTAMSKNTSSSAVSPLIKVVNEGLNVPESSIIFSVSPSGSMHSRDFKMEGDVFSVRAACLDVALWKIGGAAVALRLVQVANTPHEVSRALGVLTDGLKNSWQNSEDMERLRGYEILADILRGKTQMINISGFETLFEFLGLNFRSPEQSTVVNIPAYRAIALDFELWSRTRKEIQRVYLEHFTTVVQTSRFKRFNVWQRYTKLGLVRRLLFVLQTDWFERDMAPFVMVALRVIMQAQFTKDGTIKPIVSYLAANLHETSKPSGSVSPRSIISPINNTNHHAKAELVLELLVSTLSTKSYHTKFAAALPLPRILLLLLGNRPSPIVATLILSLIGISIGFSSSFIRKFELINGWNILKTVLPYCWDSSVSRASIDIMLGRSCIQTSNVENSNTVVCPNIVPAIISAMHTGLIVVVNNCEVSDAVEGQLSWTTESNMEVLVEEFMDLHASSPTFRQVFKSQQTTQQFVDAYKLFVSKVIATTEINQRTSRILEKLTHFGLALALDVHISGSQKRQILETLQSAETFLDPTANKLTIDPGLVVDARSVRQRIASARFSMQVGEKNVIQTIARLSEWRKTIQVSERKRLRKTILDLRETQRQISCLYEWIHLLTSERGLWPRQTAPLWRLDETEGPYRIRKKLEPQNDKFPSSRVDANEQHDRDVQVPATDTTPVNQVEVPPWAESYEISASEMDDKQLAEEIADDKHRRVRHELEPGDVIEAVGTVARVAGVDSSPGLLIIGRTHLYMLDGLMEDDNGAVIEAIEAPKHLFFVPGSIVEFDGPQRAQRWSHDQIATYSDRTFLFRDVALEIYFKDSRSLLIVFLMEKKRVEIDRRLTEIIGRHSSEVALTPGLPRTPKTPRIGSKVMSEFRADELSAAQRRWQAREISNFTYLSILNQISGRTPSDATQYPVFPWILKDYTSRTLDLHSPESYRDLTKPMGALTPARTEAAETRYANLRSVGEEPFHYGTHFSSSMIVCHFLIRMSPFTNMFKTLQGGDWDLPDRLFSDIARAYESAAQDVRGDVRELIPEFFTCPEFLENSANLDFGVQHSTGERIHDVKLPPWAHKDPLLFVILNRSALESSYASKHLPAWIDLIWGCKQRDPESLNAFHPLSYEGSIDLDKITDELEREATVGIIHNFGQTPHKLFNAPHPQRLSHGLPSLPIGVVYGVEEHPHLLVQESRCFRDLGSAAPVRELALDVVGEKILPCPEGVLCAPLHPHEQVEWRSGGRELRVVVDQRVVQVIEDAFCNCATFADPQCLVTGSSDYTVRLWRITRDNPAFHNSAMHLTLSHIMRIHTQEVTCITASRIWSIALSGSKDGSAALWDLNRGVYVRSIWHGKGEEPAAVNLVAINESTGYIATCSQLKLCLHTINARLMASLDLAMTPSFSRLVPTITALAFHEREYSHRGVIATGGPDGSITLRTWTTDGTPDNEIAQWKFVTIRTMKARMVGHGVTRPPSITSLKFLGESLCHGEETGKAYMWCFPD
ncbi:beach-domain-containing protein [Tricholoma matsutake]|nr:beach-domain-containing protein [Tricholoma matsutake 945]